MRRNINTILIHTFGWLLIVLGLAGLLLPIMPGIFLIILGIYLLSFRVAWVRRDLEKFLSAHPKIQREYVKVETFIRQIGE